MFGNNEKKKKKKSSIKSHIPEDAKIWSLHSQ